jgi:hypothetical protein
MLFSNGRRRRKELLNERRKEKKKKGVGSEEVGLEEQRHEFMMRCVAAPLT